MKIKELLHRINRRWVKLRLQPIRVFCFHQVSKEYEPLTMWKCDWTQTDVFIKNIISIQKRGVTFISLAEAHEKLKYDWFRHKKYAVLTADDGYKSILNILPWLKDQQIPITLFINTKYLDGKSWSAINEEQARRVKPDVDMLKDVCPNLYLSKEDLKRVVGMPNVTIGMHGHEHWDASKQAKEDFEKNVLQCRKELKAYTHTIPYFAYTWGRQTSETDKVLKEYKIIPVIISGGINYDNSNFIDRIAIDGKNESNI